MSSLAFEALGLDDAVKMTAGNGGGARLHLALHATFDAQQDPPRH